MASLSQRSRASSFFKAYLPKQVETATAIDVDARSKEYECSLISFFNLIEAWVMTVQSLLVWEKPYKSAILFGSVNVIFWLVSSLSNHLLAVISWGVLILYLTYLWRTQIWPTIKVPSPLNEDEWVPVEANLLSVPELSRHLADLIVACQVQFMALVNLRQKRRNAFFILMMVVCSLLFVIGHYTSGFTLAYIAMMSILIWPCAVYHNILPRVYMVVEPHLMTLQYRLMTRLNISSSSGSRIEGGDADIEIDTDDNLPSADPELSTAIARSITDSEDEGGSPCHSPNYGVDAALDESNDGLSLAPQVALMPDFENVCEDSNTFMLDTTEMPDLDDIDHSRMVTEPSAPPLYDTDSDTESLPFDLPSHSAPQVPESDGCRALPSAPPVESWAAMANELVSGLMQAAHDDLKVDPRDRIADASLVESDSDSDFEFVLKEEIGGEVN